jgi:hypothetical protein
MMEYLRCLCYPLGSVSVRGMYVISSKTDSLVHSFRNQGYLVICREW